MAVDRGQQQAIVRRPRAQDPGAPLQPRMSTLGYAGSKVQKSWQKGDKQGGDVPLTRHVVTYAHGRDAYNVLQ